MITIDELLRAAKKYHKTLNEKRIREAYLFAEQAHAGQTRMSGEAYISHPVAVAMLMTKYKADENSIITALLHDVVEDTKHGKNEIEKRFGKMVAKMVDTLTKLPHSTDNGNGFHDFDSKIESIRKIFEVMQQDVRVLVLKLCDRVHNMSTLKHFRKDKQHRIAQETLDIYVKIADRLSIYELKEQLEALSFQYLHPEEYQELQDQWSTGHDAFMRRKNKLLERLSDKPLLKKAKDVVVRQYIPYSKWKGGEMLPIESQIFIMFPRAEDCYLALKEIHEIWKYKRSEMKDYISLPKSNGYQALQTSVVRRDGSVVTFIIQTPEMYEYGRNGVMLEAFNPSSEGKKIHLPWIDHLKKIHQKTKEKSGDYMMALQNDILKGAIIIYTDDNKTVFLPPKSTALDAAFYYVGKKAQFLTEVQVNGSSRSLSTYLNDGDNLKFIFSNRTQLLPEWLEMISTSYSKSTIAELIAKMSSRKQLQYGQALLQRELHKRGFGYIEEIDHHPLKNFKATSSFESLNELCRAIAVGDFPVAQACDILLSTQKKSGESVFCEYGLKLEFVPHKYQSLSRLLNLLNNPQIILKKLTILTPDDDDLVVNANLCIKTNYFETFYRSLKGLYDIRSVQLREKKRMEMGKWITALFIVLVSFDPISAYLLINTYSVDFNNLVSIRFLTILLFTSGILLFRKMSAQYVKETAIDYMNKDFFLLVLGFFLTAFFTYLSFDQQITPFVYQFTMYIFIYLFLGLHGTVNRRLPFIAFLTSTLVIFFGYHWYISQLYAVEPKVIFYTIAAALSFIVYSFYSVKFQNDQHIYRRSLTFFRMLSLFGLLLSLVPYFILSQYTLPTLFQFLVSVTFTLFFILLPYYLWFHLSSIYSFGSDTWKNAAVAVFIVNIAEVFVLGIPYDYISSLAAIAFIVSYWIYKKVQKNLN